MFKPLLKLDNFFLTKAFAYFLITYEIFLTQIPIAKDRTKSSLQPCIAWAFPFIHINVLSSLIVLLEWIINYLFYNTTLSF
jgi:hypothetical protein